MELFEAIHARRAVRQYRPDPVPKEEIQKILDAANQAPSAMNLQQWEFVVVTSRDTIRKMGASYRAIVEEFTKNWDPAPLRGSLSRDVLV